MDRKRVEYMHGLLVKAAVQASGVRVEFPTWRFDGIEIYSVKELALHYAVPEIEIRAMLLNKDIHSGSASGVITVGVGSKPRFVGVHERANALAYGNRRKRRKKTKEKDK